MASLGVAAVASVAMLALAILLLARGWRLKPSSPMRSADPPYAILLEGAAPGLVSRG